MSRRRSSPATAPPLDDDDLLRDILLRLPPNPSSLPRASLVCTLWRSILSDAEFLRRFRKHHRKPPLLGFFTGYEFIPILDGPDRIPSTRFSMPRSRDPDCWTCDGIRHGLAVLLEQWRRETIVWDPLTGQHHRVAFPPGLEAGDRDMRYWHAAVLCADAEDGHVHGDCFLSPFRLVLIYNGRTHTFACVYESASGVWGDIVSVASTDKIYSTRLSVLVGNALCWLLRRGRVLVFDFERQSLGVIEKPADAHVTYRSVQIVRTEDSGLGLAILSKLTIQLWQRKSNFDGVVGWVLLQKTIQLDDLFPRTMHSDCKMIWIMGYSEDINVIVLSTMTGVFMLQLDSMQTRHIITRNEMCYNTFHPYKNFYTAGRGVGWKWVDLEL